MTKSTQLALIYGLSLTAAGVVAFWRDRRGQDLLIDTTFHGALLGTGLAVTWYLLSDGSIVARMNDGVEGMGRTPPAAMKLLGTLNTDVLYADMNQNGVKIGPVPENPAIISQEP